MKNKPDDRRDNVEKIQKNIDHTIQNMELANEIAAKSDHEKTKRDLLDKNKRREDALDAMRSEIKDEADDRKKGYKE